MERIQSIFASSAKFASIVAVALLYTLYFHKLQNTSCLWDFSDARDFTSYIIMSALAVIFPITLVTQILGRRLSFALTGACAFGLATYLILRWFIPNETTITMYTIIASVVGFIFSLFAPIKRKVGLFSTVALLSAISFPILIYFAHTFQKNGVKIFFVALGVTVLFLWIFRISRILPVFIFFAAIWGAVNLWPGTHYSVPSSAARPEGKNLIILTIDALRADAIEPYNPKYKTPAFLRLANRSIVFDNAYANSPWTMPSLASIFCGLNPRAHGCAEPTRCLAKELDSLAELFKNHGFTTIAVIYHPLFEVLTGFEQGFDVYSIITCHPIELYRKYFYPISRYAEEFFDGFPLLTELATITTIKKIKSADSPFFLWIHHYDPHSPYSPPKKFFDLVEKPKKAINLPEHPAGYPKSIHSEILQKHQPFSPPPKPHEIKYVRDMYQAEVSFVDAELNILLDFLESSGLAKSTYIILTADHGEEFYEHNGWDHGRTLYRELLHIPLMISGPNIAPSRNGCLADNTDVFATALKLLGIASPTAYGRELVEIAKSQNCQKKELIFSSSFEGDVERDAILSPPYKLIYPPLELYRIDKDPSEQNEISAQNIDLALKLKLKLQEKVAADYRMFKKLGIKPTPTNEKKLQRELLKSLGYID